jgi:hypothetical protein
MAELDEAAARAVAQNFAGDVKLYLGFAAVCARQFEADARQGQAACAAGQLQALRGVAHNLRFALELLLQPRLAGLADAVERDADAGVSESATAAWQELQPALQALALRLGQLPAA